mmetsp:Transcript_35843/g.77305  ORF Transcript_35843/g.77305 Transcript_35843/m.77305 type:complete len:260 (-) Transcript_35843:220-999(-)
MGRMSSLARDVSAGTMLRRSCDAHRADTTGSNTVVTAAVLASGDSRGICCRCGSAPSSRATRVAAGVSMTGGMPLLSPRSVASSSSREGPLLPRPPADVGSAGDDRLDDASAAVPWVVPSASFGVRTRSSLFALPFFPPFPPSSSAPVLCNTSPSSAFIFLCRFLFLHASFFAFCRSLLPAFCSRISSSCFACRSSFRSERLAWASLYLSCFFSCFVIRRCVPSGFVILYTISSFGLKFSLLLLLLLSFFSSSWVEFSL